MDLYDHVYLQVNMRRQIPIQKVIPSSGQETNLKLDRLVDRVKPWFMVHGLAHGS